jgi:predicted nuclease of predicted toxin-antitoxin system
VKLLVDAQLPKRLARWLATRGHDVLHTLDLPGGNRTPDAEIIAVACREDRIVVSKDGDFVDSHLVRRRPPKLLLIATGNVGNANLERIFERNIRAIEAALEASNFVELTHDNLIVHE